jgi:hypothetical protein
LIQLSYLFIELVAQITIFQDQNSQAGEGEDQLEFLIGPVASAPQVKLLEVRHLKKLKVRLG